MRNKEIGAKIKAARLEKGLTQQDLAKIVGVTPESISYYEAGKKFPGFDRLKTICRVLGLSVDSL
ncbi:MAG TPA: helix-turn-helix transcriptional regulator [Mobilitalea sp.]|nr:helix-turn-helix transcriptional regulator [Mobilitalea sp.]